MEDDNREWERRGYQARLNEKDREIGIAIFVIVVLTCALVW
jgi:hypothetical protein